MSEYSEFVEFMGDSCEDNPFVISENQIELYQSRAVQQVIAMSNMDISYPQVRGSDLKAARLMPIFINSGNPEDRFITNHYLGKQYTTDIENAFAASYLHFVFDSKFLETRVKPKSAKFLQDQIDATLPGLSKGFEEIISPKRQIQLISIANAIRNGKTNLDNFSAENQREQLPFEQKFIQDYIQLSTKPRGVKLLLKVAQSELDRIRAGEEYLGDQLLDLFTMVMDSTPEEITRRQIGYMYDYTGGSKINEDNSADLAFKFAGEMTELKYNPPHNTIAEVFVYNLAKLGGKETIVEGDEFVPIDDVFLTQQQATELITDIEESLGNRMQASPS